VEIKDVLEAFAVEKKFKGRKGPLSVALVVTQHGKSMGLPLNPEALVTEGGGQVLGLGRGAVQAVLKRHGLTRVLASEGGRTSRGSLNNMREYVRFLNGLAEQGKADLDAVERFWVGLVKEYFAGKPFRIRLDNSRGLRTLVRDVVAQAEARQKTSQGMHYAGAVMQHVVGAKLDCVLGAGHVEHNSFSTADAPSGRAGDFFLGDVAVHVTTSPGEALIERCRDNLNDGYRPVIVTGQKGMGLAEGLAENAGLAERIDVFEVEQFVSLNLYEMGRFEAAGRRSAVADLVERYNHIVDEVETDPSLRIEVRR